MRCVRVVSGVPRALLKAFATFTGKLLGNSTCDVRKVRPGSLQKPLKLGLIFSPEQIPGPARMGRYSMFLEKIICLTAGRVRRQGHRTSADRARSPAQSLEAMAARAARR